MVCLWHGTDTALSTHLVEGKFSRHGTSVHASCLHVALELWGLVQGGEAAHGSPALTIRRGGAGWRVKNHNAILARGRCAQLWIIAAGGLLDFLSLDLARTCKPTKMLDGQGRVRKSRHEDEDQYCDGDRDGVGGEKCLHCACRVLEYTNK